jgi:hypothetical protein
MECLTLPAPTQSIAGSLENILHRLLLKSAYLQTATMRDRLPNSPALSRLPCPWPFPVFFMHFSMSTVATAEDIRDLHGEVHQPTISKDCEFIDPQSIIKHDFLTDWPTP